MAPGLARLYTISSSLFNHEMNDAFFPHGCSSASFFKAPKKNNRFSNRRRFKVECTSGTNNQNITKNVGSLIPEVLEQMKTDVEFQTISKELKQKGAMALAKEERERRRRALDDLGIPSFQKFISKKNGGKSELKRKELSTLQLNIGLFCNQACSHCHVESSPLRKEMMDRQTAEKIVSLMEKSSSIKTVDITGGAPELNSQFRYLVEESFRLNKEIIDRSNLTVFFEPGQEDLPFFLSKHEVRIIASLPCYSKNNVDKQRGNGVFNRSIDALLMLNEVGYGKENTNLILDLVYNPLGPALPPSQKNLEIVYKKELKETFGIEFNNLFTITNMPIKRFADQLHRSNQMKSYMELLVNNYNIDALDNVMCRNLISISWDGKIFDCDFNQQLLIPTPHESQSKSIFDLNSFEELVDSKIALGNHCFGCTAGQGSSCTGVVV